MPKGKSKKEEEAKKENELKEKNEQQEEREQEKEEELQNLRKALEEKEAEIASLKLQNKSFLEKLQRLGADFDNYKKRQEIEFQKARGIGFSDAVKSFLPLVDSFSLAISKTTGKEKDSLEVLFVQLLSILESLGFSKICPEKGDDFNPSIHESLTSEETEEFDDGKILEVFQIGFSHSGNLVRPARVKISKRKKDSASETQENPENAGNS